MFVLDGIVYANEKSENIQVVSVKPLSDEDTFKKEINPSTNALMTLCLLELLDYYNENDHIFLI